MAKVMELHGYKVLGLFERTNRKRKPSKAGGRKSRSFYEGKYVYLRVRLPDGSKRDFYVGSPGRPGRRRRRLLEVQGGETRSPASSSSRARSGWRKRVENGASADTRDPADDRTMPLPFDSPRYSPAQLRAYGRRARGR